MGELGRWITDGSGNPFYGRKKFQIDKAVASATVKVCGLGQFALYLNGKKVGDHELDPAWTNYEKWIEYVTFDITNLLVSGENCIGAEVGNGWYIKQDEHYTFAFPPFMPPNPNPYKPFAESLVLAMEVVITYADGSQEQFTADDSFEVCEHPVVMANVYGSETIDGRKYRADWCMPQGSKEGWQQAIVVAIEAEPQGILKNQFQPPVQVIHSYEGTFLHEVMTEAGQKRHIYDFGQNISGILDVWVIGQAGETVRFYPAEKLAENGDVDQVAKGWCTVDTCITYIFGESGVWEHVRMHFSYFAGRFMAVEGDCELRDMRGDAISSAVKNDGTFHSDNEKYDQILEMIRKTVEANMIGVHTDCPQIERFAWQEPNHLMAPAIFYMKDGKLLWEKFLMDMRMEQHTAQDYFMDLEGKRFYPGEGLMPSQCPCYIHNVLPVPGMGSFYDIIPWGSTSILGVYWHYQFYGDLQFVRDNYESGMRYLAHLNARVTEDGFINHGLGDWGNPKQQLARENIETAFLYADTKTLAYFAELLEKEEDAKRLWEDAEKIKQNYNDKLLIQHPQEGFYCYKAWDHPDEILLTQAAQALPLFWGMVPDEHLQDVVKALRYTLDTEGAFISGEVGLPYIIQAASRYGMNEQISRLIMREEHPSYYAFILDGETTLGEYWEQNPRSHCHDMMGHIAEWYFNGLAGIIPTKPGFAEVLIRPYLPEDMHSFSCTYQSVRGAISVQVTEDKQEIQVEIKCPKSLNCQWDDTNLQAKGKTIVCQIEEE